MRLLGVDFGRAKIGLAIADERGVSAIGYIRNKGMKNNLHTLNTLIKERRIDKIVFGLPLHTYGEESEVCAEVRDFARRFDIATDFQDERYTSQEAEQFLKNKKISDKKVRDLVDTTAASMILNEYLRRK